jgi:hypothetical protein
MLVLISELGTKEIVSTAGGEVPIRGQRVAAVSAQEMRRQSR